VRYLKLFLLLLFSGTVVAQNYQCIQSGVQHRFINQYGYMRSVKVTSSSGSSSGDSVLHLFRSERNATDSAINGCWLGKDALKQPDGTFFIKNRFNDTVVIKTGATVGSTWVFYNDTTNAYYLANVTSVDTQTVLGVLDSVKRIKLTAYIGSTVNTADFVNNFEIILSKDHGFVQAFDLYAFPYHKPDSAFRHGLDYLVDKLCDSTTATGTHYMTSPLVANSVFRLVDYHLPTYLELYDFSPGDAFCSGESRTVLLYNLDYSTFRYDSIVSKNVIDAWHVQYTTYSIIQRTNYYYPMSAAPFSTTSTSYMTDVINADTSLAIDIPATPEEMGTPYLYDWFYLPDDTSRGYQSPYYRVQVPFLGEVCETRYEYKQGFPTISYHVCSTSSYASFPNDCFTDYALGYSHRSTAIYGLSCGSALGVADVLPTSVISLSPNPVSGTLFIKHPIQKDCTLTLTDMLGRKVLSQVLSGGEDEIDIGRLPDGVYHATFIGDDGKSWTDKILVQH
jgi:hypothetical protein